MNGCCDSKAVCQAGTTHVACGRNAMACITCQMDQVCTDGVCGAPPCGPDTCVGCCGSDGRCSISGISSACGLGGVACVQCNFNAGCFSGVCKNCSPQSYGCASDGECCSGICSGLTAFQNGTCA